MQPKKAAVMPMEVSCYAGSLKVPVQSNCKRTRSRTRNRGTSSERSPRESDRDIGHCVFQLVDRLVEIIVQSSLPLRFQVSFRRPESKRCEQQNRNPNIRWCPEPAHTPQRLRSPGQQPLAVKNGRRLSWIRCPQQTVPKKKPIQTVTGTTQIHRNGLGVTLW